MAGFPDHPHILVLGDKNREILLIYIAPRIMEGGELAYNIRVASVVKEEGSNQLLVNSVKVEKIQSSNFFGHGVTTKLDSMLVKLENGSSIDYSNVYEFEGVLKNLETIPEARGIFHSLSEKTSSKLPTKTSVPGTGLVKWYFSDSNKFVFVNDSNGNREALLLFREKEVKDFFSDVNEESIVVNGVESNHCQGFIE